MFKTYLILNSSCMNNYLSWQFKKYLMQNQVNF